MLQQQFYVEYYGVGPTKDKYQSTGKKVAKRRGGMYGINMQPRLYDSKDNTYHCVRLINETMTNGIINETNWCRNLDMNQVNRLATCEGFFLLFVWYVYY